MWTHFEFLHKKEGSLHISNGDQNWACAFTGGGINILISEPLLWITLIANNMSRCFCWALIFQLLSYDIVLRHH